MIIQCIHCGGKITVTGDDLGKRRACPHCARQVLLPSSEADQDAAAAQGETDAWRWLTGWIPALVSLLVHMVLLILMALVSWGTGPQGEQGEEVLIGELPALELNELQEESLEMVADQPQADSSSETFTDELELAPPDFTPQGDSIGEVSVEPPPLSTGGQTGSFDAGALTMGGGGTGGWETMIRQLRRHGLDIVILFDSTGSMEGEINQVKAQIGRIGAALNQLVPKTRIGLCTYRDQGDQYVVRGIPLTGDLVQVQAYLRGIAAGGGGDHPEAVLDGLRWAIRNNDFRSASRKVILLFGDAPPHPQDQAACVQCAREFHQQQKGIISTVTCRSRVCLPSFVQIAEAGGGESFLTADERQIMTQLMVLVFGSRYREKVVEALQLMQP
jgi:hypothetical protein